MKHIALIAIIALATSVIAAAQSTNPLNYSGKMYIEAMEIYSTPRYVSYEDHAILSEEQFLPMMQVAKCVLDFENGLITAMDKPMAVKVNSTKKYSTDKGWVVVIYMDLPDEGDKAELVWPEFGSPYLQQITKGPGEVGICRMILSEDPVIGTPEDALQSLIRSLGTM